MAEIKRVTREQLNMTKEISIFDYISSRYDLVKHGRNEFRIKNNDSLVVFPDTNSFYWYSRGKGGDIIQFMIDYEGCASLPQAVGSLLNLTETSYFKQPDEKKYFDTKDKAINYKDVLETKNMELPPKAEDNKKVFAYLNKTRGIDPDIIKECINKKLIYQSVKKVVKNGKEFAYNNCVFVGYDNNNEAKYASERSVTSSGKGFKGDVENSSKEFSFNLSDKNNSKLIVTESPIDALSVASIMKLKGEDYKQYNYLSLGGVSSVALDRYLSDNSNIKDIELCLDNDGAGIVATNTIIDKYINQYNIMVNKPNEKDFNLDLLTTRKYDIIRLDSNTKENIDTLNKSSINSLPKIMQIYLLDIKQINKSIVENYVDKGYLNYQIVQQKDSSGKIYDVKACVLQNKEGEFLIGNSINYQLKTDDFIVSNDKGLYFEDKGKSNNLIVANNPMTILTHKTYLKENNKEDRNTYICTNKNIANTVNNYLKDNPNIDKVKLIIDNTAYYSKNVKTIENSLLPNAKLNYKSVELSKSKTYNHDYLISKGVDVNKDINHIKKNEPITHKINHNDELER